jgi:hypothetical protein
MLVLFVLSSNSDKQHTREPNEEEEVVVKARPENQALYTGISGPTDIAQSAP